MNPFETMTPEPSDKNGCASGAAKDAKPAAETGAQAQGEESAAVKFFGAGPADTIPARMAELNKALKTCREICSGTPGYDGAKLVTEVVYIIDEIRRLSRLPLPDSEAAAPSRK